MSLNDLKYYLFLAFSLPVMLFAQTADPGNGAPVPGNGAYNGYNGAVDAANTGWWWFWIVVLAVIIGIIVWYASRTGKGPMETGATR